MLKYSIKRLNQLGYFKPIDDIDKGVTDRQDDGAANTASTSR